MDIRLEGIKGLLLKLILNLVSLAIGIYVLYRWIVRQMLNTIQWSQSTFEAWKEYHASFLHGFDDGLDPWNDVTKDIEVDMRRIKPIVEDTRFKIVKPTIAYSLRQETLDAIKTMDDDIFEYQTYVAGALFMAGLHDAGKEIMDMKEDDYVTYLMFVLGDES